MCIILKNAPHFTTHEFSLKGFSHYRPLSYIHRLDDKCLIAGGLTAETPTDY